MDSTCRRPNRTRTAARSAAALVLAFASTSFADPPAPHGPPSPEGVRLALGVVQASTIGFEPSARAVARIDGAVRVDAVARIDGASLRDRVTHAEARAVDAVPQDGPDTLGAVLGALVLSVWIAARRST